MHVVHPHMTAAKGARHYPVMVIHQATPVKQLEHGLVAEDGLLLNVEILWDHGRACSQHDGLVCLCPCHLLQPDLLQQTQHMA